MHNTILARIANALTEDDLPDNMQFCAADELASRDINIDIEGLGQLTFPLNQEYIEKLINISAKAKFGLREQTILDDKIRNTQEIPSSKLRVTINEHSLTPMLNKMRDRLGLADNTMLIPYLHNMLIYGPGQFFEMHQDSEKLENMVASLVVVLPYPHIGGNLIIKHGKKDHIFSSENIAPSNAKCIAFYADCKHKVEKVKQGYRIALTYNLVLKSPELSNSKNINQPLKNAIADYFALEADKQPNKLVYFLDHSYTEHNLRLDMLKGTDRANTAAIYTVAKELDLIPHLALVEIRQTWTTDGDDNNPEVDELIDDDITLSYWLDKDNTRLPFGECNIKDNEICWTKDTEAFEPFETEHEGYMGNYGDTMDYWYRRAAIVVWPKSSQTAMNFMLNYNIAINELCALTNVPGNETRVIEIIEKAGKYLYQESSQNKKNDFDMFANIALYIKDKDLALSILSHFEWKILNSDIAELLAKLQMQYDINWCLDLLHSWKSHERRNKDYILGNLNSFVSNFLYYGGAIQIVELLLEVQSNAIIDYNTQAYTRKKPVELKESLPKRIDLLDQLLIACAAIKNVAVLNKIIQHVISEPESYPEISLAKLLFQLQSVIHPEYFVHYKLLQEYLIKTIDSQLALGRRAEDNWSLEAKLPCKCEHCKIANNFLHSKTAITKIWPIVAAIRDHIMDMFKGLDLPVDLTVEKKGSPHKLIMVKNEALHKNDQKRFEELTFYHKKF